jgi:hypothetical protein
MLEKVSARDLVSGGYKLVRLLTTGFVSHSRLCRRGFGIVRRALMAIVRSELVIG